MITTVAHRRDDYDGRMGDLRLRRLGRALAQLRTVPELSRIPQVERPIDFGQKPYWFDFFARPVIGGVLAWVYWYIGEPIGPLVAMNIGVSAPLILKAMAKTAAMDVSTNND